MLVKKYDFCKLLDRLIRFFLYLLIFWLPYSPAVIESCVIVGLLLFLIKRLYLFKISNEHNIKIFVKTFSLGGSFLNISIGVYLFICIISVINSVIYEIAFHGFVSKVLEWFIIYFLIIEVFTDKKYVMIAFYTLLFTAFSTVLDSFWQYYFFQKDIFLGHRIGPGMRATAGFKTPNGLGAYLTMFLPFVLSFVLYAKRKKNKIIFLLIFLLSFWSLIIAFSRGAFLGALLGLIFLIYFYKFSHRFVLRNSKIIFTGIICLFLVLGIFIFNNTNVVNFLNRKGTAAGRLSIWIESLKLIKDRPLFGHGINTYMRIFQVYRRVPSSSPTFAHNCYIQMAAETGILGLLSFLAIIHKLFYEFFKRKKSLFFKSGDFMLLSFGMLSGIFAFLVHSFFDNNLYSLQLSAFLWYMIGLYVCLLKIMDRMNLTF